MTGKHFISHHRQSVLVSPGILNTTFPLLRSHVGTCAAGPVISHAHTGQTGMDLCRKSEIQNLDFTRLVDHNVARFDVTVNDLHFMGIIKSIGDLLDDGQYIL